MTTKSLSTEEANKNRKWVILDATDVPLGRLATRAATLIRGKHKPQFTPHVDGGDFVVVINAEKIKLTGKKADNKIYYRHTGYVGGVKQITAGKLLAKNPTRLIQYAVEGMLPSGILAHRMISKLKIYTGSAHPHQAQSPEVVSL